MKNSSNYHIIKTNDEIKEEIEAVSIIIADVLQTTHNEPQIQKMIIDYVQLEVRD